MFAIVATAPKGSSMVVSVHNTETEADTEIGKLREKNNGWSYSIQIIIE